MLLSLAVLAVIPYLILISLFIRGWFNLYWPDVNLKDEDPIVSVIVPVKNEEANIYNLINFIASQDYPRNKLELIVIDDHSTDNTYSELRKVSSKYAFIKLIKLQEGIAGKKKALWEGIKESKGEFIITTDGDCSFQKSWITAMVRYYNAFPLHLIIGPVFFEHKKGFFNIFQELEFLSLIASGAGAAGIKHPVLCNGANLGAHKALFLKAVSVYNSPVASGDDIFLLQELKRAKIPAVFAKDQEAVVETKGSSNVKKFVSQRSRWTFKSKFYRDLDIILTAVTVLFTNGLLACSLLYSFFKPQFFDDFLLIYVAKSVVDYVLLYYVAQFFNRKYLLRYFLIHQVLYVFYITVIGIAGHFAGEKWKNRLS